MNVTKYADLKQSLDESEKQLCNKISEECASIFEFNIKGSLSEIDEKVKLMTEVVNNIQSCKDSYVEAAEVVRKLSSILTETEEKVTGLNCELAKVGEQADGSVSVLSEKIASLLVASGELTNKNKENEVLIEEAFKNLKKYGDEYRSSFTDVETNIDLFLLDLKESQSVISSETKTIQNFETEITCCVDNVKKCSEDYVETLQETKSELIESFELFKTEFTKTYNEQNIMIGELKEEQLKLKKIYLLGIIPVGIIIALQIVNIMC